MTPEELEKWKYNYQQNGYVLRGYFIDKFSVLEHQLELYIRVFFFGNPNSEFHFKNVILERMTLENKITALDSILKIQSKQDEKLIREITTLKNLRNRFAHAMHVIPWNYNKSIITFSATRDKNQLIGYSKKEFDSFIVRIEITANHLAESWRALLKEKEG
ncbi:hypothetical protein [Mucilaginibacter phyllosphaerae]|uniref:Uncharacterized protein n=1 Tax=Mucilaginibacter phyllosphaerae TaxID=1812349 RepID=A0A4Y8ABC0_9SPHI|nr:hypothetical protein [Mucilaginibacter phyllosphaerae]MBB3969376.1 hypothetical protein [Mucilaginibacter phyllosphaerae]TEW65837.1 hypothetical protein E2R65_11910 [Mucilaginibacter phyllosphaerae]GGH08046.1 hypothetical protein GCM10007352_13060 [Mucilaginibacter phyllosphaerae]